MTRSSDVCGVIDDQPGITGYLCLGDRAAIVSGEVKPIPVFNHSFQVDREKQ